MTDGFVSLEGILEQLMAVYGRPEVSHYIRRASQLPDERVETLELYSLFLDLKVSADCLLKLFRMPDRLPVEVAVQAAGARADVELISALADLSREAAGLRDPDALIRCLPRHRTAIGRLRSLFDRMLVNEPAVRGAPKP